MLATINRAETRKRVESVLAVAKLYRKAGAVRREMRTTLAYIPRYHGTTHKVGKPVEETAVHNVEREQYMKTVHDNVTKAIAHLGEAERGVIERCYLSPQNSTPDYLLCHEMNVSERTFRRIKARGVMELAFLLGLEVYAE
ncbi:ArpU family transcriptional regulator [Paenibacillus dendritiformis]|uniref:ArpU family phage packaging/lysis transcriptional regulator n=1 Tax=Paenibacillus dendritiformis TaxID=130049 RepID=UPI001B14D005|nr:ArpU family phage packaging/lysis transcriptional regulator [Paenibacillus dendritiformis]GIO72568.1 ArpU family transcriptional regulator [Paenibacillus dendritiformis]